MYDRVDAGTIFCTLIDDSEFEVKFRVVESEVGDINLKDEVQLIPFSSQKICQGKISEINPVIDENGMILVKAQLKNPGGLIDGMNVRVLLFKGFLLLSRVTTTETFSSIETTETFHNQNA